MIAVYHIDRKQLQTNADALDAYTRVSHDDDVTACRTLWDHQLYSLVAKVDAFNLHKALTLTNDGGVAWINNLGVTVSDRVKFGVRGTTIGDILEMGTTRYLVTCQGFAEV